MDPGHLPCQERPSMAKPVAGSYEGRKIRSLPEGQTLLGMVAGASSNDRWPASSTKYPHLVVHLFFRSPCLSPIYGASCPLVPPLNQSMSSTTHDSHLLITYLVFPLSPLFVCACTISDHLDQYYPSNIVPWFVRLLHAICITGTPYTHSFFSRSTPISAGGARTQGLLACSYVITPLELSIIPPLTVCHDQRVMGRELLIYIHT
jgi:hypothetical protein